jgi:hypothetical protein
VDDPDCEGGQREGRQREGRQGRKKEQGGPAYRTVEFHRFSVASGIGKERHAHAAAARWTCLSDCSLHTAPPGRSKAALVLPLGGIS